MKNSPTYIETHNKIENNVDTEISSDKVMDELSRQACGVPFSVMMKRAVRLKEARTASDRRKFDAYPAFLQNSIFPILDVDRARKTTDVTEKVDIAKKYKDLGNQAFGEEKYHDATIQYERALSVFNFLENTNPKWKTEGIKDDFIIEKKWKALNGKYDHLISSLLVKCYLNLSLAYIKRRQPALAVTACEEAMQLENGNAKAHFLRYKSRMISGEPCEQAVAIKDLKTAIKLNPNCSMLRKEWNYYLERRKVQKEKEKQIFSNMFARGRVYQDSNDDTRVRYYANKKFASNLPQKLSRGKYHYDNKDLDFRNPSKEMIKVAKDMNINLEDTAILKYLEKLQKEERGKNLPIRRCDSIQKYSSSDSHIWDRLNLGKIRIIKQYSNAKTCVFIIATYSIFTVIRFIIYNV